MRSKGRLPICNPLLQDCNLPDEIAYTQTPHPEHPETERRSRLGPGSHLWRGNRTLQRSCETEHQTFPDGFFLVLDRGEFDSLISQNAISKAARGGRTKLPRVFTEHGALMAANILNSDRAVSMSVYVIRAFIQMREQLAANTAILKRLAEIDKSLLLHDSTLRDIYQKLVPLLQPPPAPPKPSIGFNAD